MGLVGFLPFWIILLSFLESNVFGINRVNDDSIKKGYKIVGDVDYENVKKYVSSITPVPGGVGPMTISMLLKNTVQAATILTK